MKATIIKVSTAGFLFILISGLIGYTTGILHLM